MASPALKFDELEVIGKLQAAIARRNKQLHKKLPPGAPPTKRRGVTAPSYAVPFIAPAKVYTSTRQTTFHMAHSVITNDFTAGRKMRTTEDAAQAHGDYIDRKDAAEEIDLKEARAQGLIGDEIPELQRYSEYLDDGEIDQNHYGSLAFGNIGRTPKERREFWKAVGTIERTPKSTPGLWIYPERNTGFWRAVFDLPREDLPQELQGEAYDAIAMRGEKFRLELPVDRIEAIDKWAASIADQVGGYNTRLPSIAVSMPRGGRLQMRLIIELPHEVSALGRYEIARNFSKIFEERGLPYWTVGHKPAPFGDQRNYHLHIAYYDRPCKRLEDGTWDIQKQETLALPDGRYKVTYPLVPQKDRGAQGRGWMLAMRSRYAEEANKVLARENATKRYTPKSYADLGIDKTPGRHISQGAFNLERQGVATEEGKHNRLAQLTWEQRQARATQETRVRPILEKAAQAQTRAAKRVGGATILAALMPEIAAQEQIIVGNSKRSVPLMVEALSTGGYADQRARFFTTLMGQLNERPYPETPSRILVTQTEPEYARITRLLSEARRAASDALREKNSRKDTLEDLQTKTNQAAERLAQLTDQLERDTVHAQAAIHRQTGIDHAPPAPTFAPLTAPPMTTAPPTTEAPLPTPATTKAPIVIVQPSVPQLTPISIPRAPQIGDLFRLSQEVFIAQVLELQKLFTEVRRTGERTDIATVAAQLNLYRDIGNALGYDPTGEKRATAPLTPQQTAALYRHDLPFDGLHPQIRARLTLPPNMARGTRPSDLARQAAREGPNPRQK